MLTLRARFGIVVGFVLGATALVPQYGVHSDVIPPVNNQVLSLRMLRQSGECEDA